MQKLMTLHSMCDAYLENLIYEIHNYKLKIHKKYEKLRVLPDVIENQPRLLENFRSLSFLCDANGIYNINLNKYFIMRLKCKIYELFLELKNRNEKEIILLEIPHHPPYLSVTTPNENHYKIKSRMMFMKLFMEDIEFYKYDIAYLSL